MPDRNIIPAHMRGIIRIVSGKISRFNTVKRTIRIIPRIKNTGCRIRKIRIIPDIACQNALCVFGKLQQNAHQTFRILLHIGVARLKFFEIGELLHTDIRHRINGLRYFIELQIELICKIFRLQYKNLSALL